MSTYTRFDVETVLYSRWAGALQFVFNRTTYDPVTGAPVEAPTNRPVVPDPGTPSSLYDDPIGYGLRKSGYPPAGTPVIDGDVAVAGPRWDLFLDLSEYRLAQNLLGSFTDVTESDFGRSASYDQFASRIKARIDQLKTDLAPYLVQFRQGASSGPIRHTPATSRPPVWRPGYGGPAGGGFGRWGC